ncbi:MAG: SDR family NAD(P)-dependent oxidoreductase [Candidatus Aminicenantales bacterium]
MKPIDPAGKAVVITGCSSGIGRAAALHLASLGYTVFATVRRDMDAASLREAAGALAPGEEPRSNLIPVCPLDLTHPDEIAAAIKAIVREFEKRKLGGLYALINNAGGGGIAPVELIDTAVLRRELEARLVGPVTLLQGLLPYLRRGQGRILWITTPALLPIPFIAGIHAPDFAMNGLIRTLAVELKPWRIPNIMIRCGGIKTAAVARSARELEESFRSWPPDRLALYAERLGKEKKELVEFDKNRTEPEEVAKVIARALCAGRPKKRYRIGYMSGFAALFEAFPQSFVDFVMGKRG